MLQQLRGKAQFLTWRSWLFAFGDRLDNRQQEVLGRIRKICQRAVVEFPDWAELSLEMVGEAPIVYRKGWGSLGALLALGRKNSSLPWEEDGVSSCGS